MGAIGSRVHCLIRGEQGRVGGESHHDTCELARSQGGITQRRNRGELADFIDLGSRGSMFYESPPLIRIHGRLWRLALLPPFIELPALSSRIFGTRIASSKDLSASHP